MTNFGPVLLSVGFQEILALIFILVSIIGWVIKQVQGNNQQLPPPVQRPGRKREDRGADEIDAFLEQVNRTSEQQRPAPQRNTNRPRVPGSSGKPAATALGAGYATQANAGAGGKRQQRPPARTVPPQPTPQSPPARQSTPVGAPLSTGMAQHVSQHMGERIAQEAARDVGQSVKDSVAQHMGTGMTAPPSAGTTAAMTHGFDPAKAVDPACCVPAAQSLRAMLRDPRTIRQAIIIQEVLNRPKCLQKNAADS